MPPTPRTSSRLTLATAASSRAGSVRAALGGYVPVTASTWSAERRELVAAADADLRAAAVELRLARAAAADRRPWAEHQ